MGRLLEGVWVTRDLGPDETGRYVRRQAQFRSRVTASGGPHPAEAGRYRLYLSRSCGWSHRTLIWRALKGLDDVIDLTVLHPHMADGGWAFDPADPDPEIDASNLWQLYVHGQSDYTGRASVPVLWDQVAKTIVSNESIEICQMLDRAFDHLGNDLHLWPEDPEVSAAIDEMIAANYSAVNNGVYRVGFAASQEAYDEAAHALFDRLDVLEQHLATRRFLFGDAPTAADWCLFPTLYRFDAVYYIHFKCCLRRIQDYPNLWGYTRDLYQWPGIADTCDMQSNKVHYYTSHESIHPRRTIPLGPDIDWDAPHGRG